jgi:hypothetical protein
VKPGSSRRSESRCIERGGLGQDVVSEPAAEITAGDEVDGTIESVGELSVEVLAKR